MSRRPRSALALATSLAIASTLTLTTASAEPGGEPPQPEASVKPNNDAMTRVGEWASSHYKQPGFGKVVIDHDKGIVRVHWKGGPPAEVAGRDGSTIDGIKVEVFTSSYSEKELNVAARKLVAAYRDTVYYAHPNDDLSGLVAAVSAETAGDASRASAIEQDLTELSGIPVALVEGMPIREATRWNDSPPWQGGGILNIAGNGCSSGFSVLTASGEGRLLSASHCGSVGTVVRDGAGETIGPITNRAPAYDALLIDPSASPATVGKVFGGPWNAGTGHSRYQFWVGGAAGPVQGERVCTSGAVTGEHCGLLITNTNVVSTCASVSCTGFLFYNQSGGPSLGVGDSGGPVYITRSDGMVGARGIISGGANSVVPCGSSATATTCTQGGFGISIRHIADRFGVKVEQQ